MANHAVNINGANSLSDLWIEDLTFHLKLRHSQLCQRASQSIRHFIHLPVGEALTVTDQRQLSGQAGRAVFQEVLNQRRMAGGSRYTHLTHLKPQIPTKAYQLEYMWFTGYKLMSFSI